MEQNGEKRKGQGVKVKGQFLFMQWVLSLMTVGVLIAFFLMIVVF